MSRRGDLARLRALDGRHLLLLTQAAAALGIARLAVGCLPIRRATRLFGLRVAAPPFAAHTMTPPPGQDVAWAIATAAGRLPWHSTCLMQALAGAALLRRRRLPALVFFGVPRGSVTMGAFTSAHAWLDCDGHILTGAAEQPNFRQIVVFSPTNPARHTQEQAHEY